MNWIRVSVVLSEKVCMLISQVLEDWLPQANISNQFFFGGGEGGSISQASVVYLHVPMISAFPDWCDCLIVECFEIMASFFSIQDKEKVRFEMTHEELYSFYNQVRLEYMYVNIPVSRNFRKSCISFIIYSIW